MEIIGKVKIHLNNNIDSLVVISFLMIIFVNSINFKFLDIFSTCRIYLFNFAEIFIKSGKQK